MAKSQNKESYDKIFTSLKEHHKWFENSKYDIENGYWSLFVKLGLVGVIIFLFFVTKIGNDKFGVLFVIIWLLFSFKTSYQFFTTFDGTLLVIGVAIVRHNFKYYSGKVI